MSKYCIPALVVGCLAAAAPALSAAAPPDDSGPWADSVFAYQAGTQSTGRPVPAERSHPSAAVGVAEDDFDPDHFVSLGIGGRVALRFTNSACTGAGPDLRLREATMEPYPEEKIDVYVSENGQDLVAVAKGANKDADLEVPGNAKAFRYVVLVDATDPRRFKTADGYDLDGVAALHTTGCPAPSADKGLEGSAGGTGRSGDSTPGTSGTGGASGVTLLGRAPGLTAATCRVPTLKGRTVRGARNLLRKHNCATGRISIRRSSIRKGRVVRTLPGRHVARPYRTKVRLVVSRGRGR